MTTNTDSFLIYSNQVYSETLSTEKEGTHALVPNAIKIGVQWTKSGELVVIDNDVVITPEGNFENVNTFSLSELCELFCTKLLTLDQYFETYKDKNIPILIEIKSSYDFNPIIVQKIYDDIVKYDMDKWVKVSSYRHDLLLALMQLAQKEVNGKKHTIPCYISIGREHSIKNIVSYAKENLFAGFIPKYVDIKSSSIIEEAHKENLQVYAFSVESEEIASKMKDLGCDGVILKSTGYIDKIHY